MKKVYLLFMMLFLCALLFTACKDGTNPPVVEINEITLAVSGGSSDEITVTGTDLIKDVLITAATIVDRDIEVNLVTSVADGSAVLSASQVTIAKGTNKATVQITFPAAKFPKETAGKAIKVTASTNADKVIFSPDFTTFNVKGEDGQSIPAVLTATAGTLEVNTTDAIGEAVINFTLSKALDKDMTIDGAYEKAVDFIGIEGVGWNPFPVKIAKGKTSLKLSITVPKGRIGSMPLRFTTKSSDVTVDIPLITFTFVETVNPNPEASISTAEALAVNVAGSNVVRTINVKLSKAADKIVTVNLTTTSNNSLNGTLSASSVTFGIGELTKTVDLTFAHTDFIKESEAKITVKLTSTEVDVKASASSLLFSVAGPSDKQDGKVVYRFSRSDDANFTKLGNKVTFTEADKTQGYILLTGYGEISNKNITKFAPAVTFTLEAEGGLSAADIELTDARLIYPGDYYHGYAKLKLMKSAIGKTGTIRFVSAGTTFAKDQDWVITVQ